jgi:hypothetical protein
VIDRPCPKPAVVRDVNVSEESYDVQFHGIMISPWQRARPYLSLIECRALRLWCTTVRALWCVATISRIRSDVERVPDFRRCNGESSQGTMCHGLARHERYIPLSISAPSLSSGFGAFRHALIRLNARFVPIGQVHRESSSDLSDSTASRVRRARATRIR